MELSLRQFTLVTTILGLTLTLFFTYCYLEERAKEIFVENKVKTAESISRLLNEEICKRFELPHSKEHLKKIIDSLEKSFGRELDGDIVTGECKKVSKVSKGRVTHFQPIRFKEKCSKCHRSDETVCLYVTLDFSREIRKFEISFVQLVTLIVVIPLILSFVYSELLRRFITTKIKAINVALNKGKSLDETIRYLEDELNKSKSFLKEIEDLRTSLLKCIEDVGNMAVDKEVLENQLKIMEKLIITSEVLKDWETPVKECQLF